MEVYGVKPKKFTKKWWGYFWYYYKWHTAGVLFAAVLMIITFVQCVTQTKYDLQIDFITEYGIIPEQEEMLAALIEENIEDVTGNGEKEAFVLSLNMGEGDAQMMQAMTTKLFVELGYSESYVFIMSKKYADAILEHDIFENSDVWAGDLANGEPLISLKECLVLPEMWFDMEVQDLYIGVLKVREENKANELELKRYENGKRFAQFLINQR